jgi:hypothetical protein
MNREDIIRMAEQAGAIHYWHLSILERFAALIAAAERDEMAKHCVEITRAAVTKAVDGAVALEREACTYRAGIALLGADRGLANRVDQAIRARKENT